MTQSLSRRKWLELNAAAGIALGGRLAVPASRARASASRVHLDTDGVGLTPPEFIGLLGRLAGRVTPDEYSLGGEVERLETLFARLLGKEQAVFLPSGTLANHLAVRTLSKGRSRVIVQEISHLYNDSGDCAEKLSGLNLVPLAPGQATFTREEVERLLARTASGRVTTGVGVISIESPVRRLHGQAFDLAQMRAISTLARDKGIGLHLDGARLFAASAYSGIAPQDYAALFDTVYVSLWKCFSSGSGAILAGPHALLADLFQARRMFGGAIHTAWPFAAVAAHYAEGLLERLGAAVGACEALIAELAGQDAIAFERVPNGTTKLRLTVRGVDPAAYQARLLALGIILPDPEEGGFWLTVNETWSRRTARELAAALRGALA